ncbi:KpsF/GutQ family sugar-phosphate isomerase [Methylomagnum sp.]
MSACIELTGTLPEVARRVFEEQASALLGCGARLGSEFDRAVNLILETQGRVIISGMGKSGIIGKKIAATFASTGTPSFFVHPAEAFHGDLGMITASDGAILISYSGETEELLRLIPSLKRFGTKVIAMVGNPASTLGKNADVVLDVSVEREVCPNNLAPTTSTTVALVMGDALAVALIQRRDFQPQDFAVFHPGGSLGRRLLTRVKDVMHRDFPVNPPQAGIRDVIVSMTRGRLGLTVVMEDGHMRGLITDGDLRRALLNHERIDGLTAVDIMTVSPRTISDDLMFAEAEHIMLKTSITALLAVDGQGALSGVLKLQDAGQVA